MSEKFRRIHLEETAEDFCSRPTKKDTFTCDHCGKFFRQKKYLSQHITKLHINKKNTLNSDLKLEIEDIIIKEDDLIKDEQNKENTEDISESHGIKLDPSDNEDLENIINDIQQDISCSEISGVNKFYWVS